MENLRTYGRTKKIVDQSALKFTDLLNLNRDEKQPVSNEKVDPETQTCPSRSRRVAAVTAAANLKPTKKATTTKSTSKRTSTDEEGSKENASGGGGGGAGGDVKLFQSSSSSTSTTSSSCSSVRESVDWRKAKRTSGESATATAIVNSMSIDMESTASSNVAAPKLKSIVKPSQSELVVEMPAQQISEIAVPANPVGRPKRVVRILEELDTKKERILENVKPDNKQKHTASTSTPSGGRRKPLKAPGDVSLIVKPSEADQSK